MWVTKAHFIALGLVTAGAMGMGLLAAGPQLAGSAPVAAGMPESGGPAAPQSGDPSGTPAQQTESGVRVDAPGTRVEVDRERGKVSVTAPHTDVRVDPDKSRVQVRAPYVNLDIRW
jgi:hypothetical protein